MKKWITFSLLENTYLEFKITANVKVLKNKTLLLCLGLLRFENVLFNKPFRFTGEQYITDVAQSKIVQCFHYLLIWFVTNFKVILHSVSWRCEIPTILLVIVALLLTAKQQKCIIFILVLCLDLATKSSLEIDFLFFFVCLSQLEIHPLSKDASDFSRWWWTKRQMKKQIKRNRK